MAKTIKFNLICDGYPARTLDDLRENFCIEDILAYYKNDLLQRWLTVRGYEKELEAIKTISPMNDEELIYQLIRIFDIESDSEDIRKNIQILKYKEITENRVNSFVAQKYNCDKTVADYFNGYTHLIIDIIENDSDLPLIKAAIKEIGEKYQWIFDIDYRSLFKVFYQYAPLAIFVMLTIPSMREKYLQQQENDILSPVGSMYETFGALETGIMLSKKLHLDDKQKALEDYKELDQATMRQRLYQFTTTEALTDIFGENLMSFSGVTDSYWKDLEPKGKKYMILSMENGNNVRSSGNRDQNFGYNEVHNRFLILDGIDYRSNKANDKLLYMEV